MFEYASDGFRRVFENGYAEASARRQSWIGVEHLWKGITLERDSGRLDAVALLGRRGFDLGQLDHELDLQLVKEGAGNDADQKRGPEPSPRVRYVRLRSIQIALELGEASTSSGHLLASLLTTMRPAAVEKLDISLPASDIADWKTGEHPLNPKAVPPPRESPGAFLVSDYAQQFAADDVAANGRVSSYHYLLALLAESDTIAGQILREHGVDVESVRRAAEALSNNPTLDRAMFTTG